MVLQRTYTEAEKMLFHQMHSAKETAKTIAKTLGRNVDSIRGYAARNNLSFKYDSVPQKTKNKKSTARILRVVFHNKTTKGPNLPNFKEAKNEEFELSAAGKNAIHISMTNDRQCKWLHGESPQWLCCGDEIYSGSNSYCEKHHAITRDKKNKSPATDMEV